MSETCDVLVIGGGMAGVAAALRAARAGARVVLVRAGPGASAVCSGAWYHAPPEPVAQLLADAGLRLGALTGGVPHPHGPLIHAAAAAESHMHAALNGGAERALICGIAGLPGFRPRALARIWSDAVGLTPGSLTAVTLTIPDTPPTGWSEVSLAALLEREPLRLGEPLAHAVREHGAARVILPAVAGLERHADTLAQLQSAAGVAVGEALGVAPSVPGWRLDVALRAAARRAGVALVPGRVEQRTAQGTRLTGVTAATPAGMRTFRAHSFVLATGKFLGGGVAAEAGFMETALACDVVAERFGRTFNDAADSLVLTDADRLDAQPLLQLGVRTDGDGRPLGAAGAVRYDNVFVAGSIRSGADAATFGLGPAAEDGWQAGARAAGVP